MATAVVSNVSNSTASVDYVTIAEDMTYQLSKPEEATNFCISVSDITELVSKVLRAADNHAINPKTVPPAAAAMDEDDSFGGSYHSYPRGLSVVRTMTSGIPEYILSDFILLT